MSSNEDLVALRESHSWPRAIGFSVAISMCIAVDILQYSFPLSFLPRSLEDGGHSSKHIAAVIGGYYWSGFAGGVVITIWQIYRILFRHASVLSLKEVKYQIFALVVGLLIGSATLVKQATDGSYTVHIWCRIIQGFLGAILFFYSYLLSIELFTGKQQIFALTLNTISLNIAEVGGPLLGATVFTVAGQASSFYFLTIMSTINQGVLLYALWWLHQRGSSSSEDDMLTEQLVVSARLDRPAMSFRHGFSRFLDVISSPYLWKSLTVIAPSALLKAEIENILPLFADHSLGYDTMSIGISFSAVALAFVVSSVSIGVAWDVLTIRTRDSIVGFSLICLCVFSTAIVPVTQMAGLNETVFMTGLACYGIFLGLTITPSSFMLGEFVDSLRDSQSKDVANGIWNTLWEMGGSVGFFLAGIPKSNDWRGEQTVISISSITLIIAAIGFFYINDIIRSDLVSAKLGDDDLEQVVVIKE
jgi:MFS family permease